MGTSRILLHGPDWVTTKGIQYVLESAGHHVLDTTGQSQMPPDAQSVALGLIAVDGVSPLGANPAVALCARHTLPVVWLLTKGSPDRVIQMSSVQTVGLLVMPVHESQLLAAIDVGLSLAEALRGSASGQSAPSSSPSGAAAHDRYGVALERLPLTRRQREIVQMMLDGDRVSTIAEGLGISPATVRAHLNRIFAKLGVHSQAMLVKTLKTGSGTGPDPDATP